MKIISYNTLKEIAEYANKVAGIKVGRGGWSCDTIADVCFRFACGRVDFAKMAKFEAVRVYAETLIGEECEMYVGMYGEYDDAVMTLFVVPVSNIGHEHGTIDFAVDYERVRKERAFVCSSDDEFNALDFAPLADQYV